MVEIDKKLVDLYVNHATNVMKIDIRDDVIVSMFTKESLSNAIADSEVIYPENYEVNRKRKMRIVKTINNKVNLFPITEENLNCADSIRSVLVNNSLFENLSDFCNLEFNEKQFADSFDIFADMGKNMESLRDQCYKDLFILRLIWFSNQAHKLITELPLPQDTEAKKQMLYQKMLLREFINANTKEFAENFLNLINPRWMYKLENSKLTINEEKQQLTEFGNKKLKNVASLLARNGYGKDMNSCISNFADAKDEIEDFFDIMQACFEQVAEMQTEAYKKKSQEKSM